MSIDLQFLESQLKQCLGNIMTDLLDSCLINQQRVLGHIKYESCSNIYMYSYCMDKRDNILHIYLKLDYIEELE